MEEPLLLKAFKKHYGREPKHPKEIFHELARNGDFEDAVKEHSVESRIVKSKKTMRDHIRHLLDERYMHPKTLAIFLLAYNGKKMLSGTLYVSREAVERLEEEIKKQIKLRGDRARYNALQLTELAKVRPGRKAYVVGPGRGEIMRGYAEFLKDTFPTLREIIEEAERGKLLARLHSLRR